MYSFENLKVWQESIDLSVLVYEKCKNYPTEEKYGIVSQMTRAVISVSSNIAEGTSKSSFKDQLRFVEIAYGSLMELLSQTIISLKLKYINEKEYNQLRAKIDEVSKLLSGYRKSLIKRGKLL